MLAYHPEIGGNIMILLAITAVLVFRYLIGRMRHKEIMAALEKGIEPSELKGALLGSPRWITNICFGIILLIIGLCLITFSMPFWSEWKPSSFLELAPTGVIPVIILFVGIAVFGIGTANLIRGLLLRKVERAKARNAGGGSVKSE